MRTLLGIVALLVLSFQANAGETSRSNVLGFSQDGRYFAFEEFGISDGSGAPYATLYVIDTSNDSWVPGTPVSLPGGEDEGHAIEAETAKLGLTDKFLITRQYELALAKKRETTLSSAATVMKKIGPLYPGSVRATNQPFEFSSEAISSRFSLLDYEQALNNGLDKKVMRLELELKEFPATENCFGFYEATYGYKLTLINETTGVARVLNDDSRIPASRRCPQGYRIENVVSFRGSGPKTVIAVLLRYSTLGFEGPDGRLLAATAQINE